MTNKSPAFGLLGPLQMSVDGTAVPLGSPKQRAVLAALLMNRNRPVAVESLIAAVWGEEPPSEARTNIHVYVSNLRRLLGTAGVDARELLEKRSPGYRLNVEDADVDLGRFIREKMAGVQAAAAGRFEDGSRHFSAALAEWRGPVLEDIRAFEFSEIFAVALTEDKIAAHTARAQAEIACGRAEAVVGELETLVADHPYREPAWAQLMTAYYLAGRQSDALEAYSRLRATLADELGIDPNPTLRDLQERILRQEPLDVEQSARQTADETLVSMVHRRSSGGSVARLRTASGQCHPMKGSATRIGRLPDNDIVLADAKASRYHAVIIDTGTSFVINDAGSANGVEVNHQRILGSAILADGDHIQIGDTEFTFELHEGDAEPVAAT